MSTFAAAPSPTSLPTRAEPALREVVRAGVGAGVLAMSAAIGWILFCGEVANAPTPVPGVRSSTWTGVTAVTGVIFGSDAVHGSFHVLSIAFGIGLLLVLGGVLGAVGAAIVHETIGPVAGAAAAVTVGLAYGFVLQIVLVNLVVNAIQDRNDLYGAMPSWGWWVASATYGIALALLVTRRWRRAAPAPA
ncbi:MAG TPA: hypothetical protein VFT50_07025 [Baekduia sp.]|nr:hypothetical protein [Baekduia sp.]